MIYSKHKPVWTDETVITESRQLCEICGQPSEDCHERRAYTTHSRKHRTNRTKIDAGYFDQRYSWREKLIAAGMENWADKMACRSCHKKFTDVLNKA